MYICVENFKFMKFIANILTDKQFNNNELYNVVDDKDKLIDGIPTLVIGWGYTKKMYPDASILKWSIDRNVYWTYGKREKRSRYEENIAKFRELAITRFIKSVRYKFYNLLTISDIEKEYIISLFIKDNGSIVYINYDMVYVLDSDENIVIGFSLRDLDYIGKDRKKIFSMIFKNKNNVIVDIKNLLSWETKTSLGTCSYVIPYLYA